MRYILWFVLGEYSLPLAMMVQKTSLLISPELATKKVRYPQYIVGCEILNILIAFLKKFAL